MRARSGRVIFISYAWKDDQRFVLRLYADLEQLGYRPWMDKHDLQSRGRSLPREIQDQLQGCDRVLAVIGPAALVSEACKAERAFALNAGKVVTSILRKGEYGMLPQDISRDLVQDFRSFRSYKTALRELVNILDGPLPVLGCLFDVPFLPTHVLRRREELSLVRDALTSAEFTEQAAISSTGSVGLHGMAGIGKTMLAMLAARDHVVRRQFRDGIFWITIGRQPDLLRELYKMLRALGEVQPNNLDLPSARMKLSEAIEGKECLLILDDVWAASSVEAFRRAINPRCRLLVTTRNLDVIRSLGLKDHHIDLLSLGESRVLLAHWSDSKEDTLPQESIEIIRECGRLPFAVAIAGAMLRKMSRPGWKLVCGLLRGSDLGHVKMQFPDYPYSNIMRAIQISLDNLSEDDRDLAKRFLDLAVLPEGILIHPVLQQTLWSTDADNSLETAERLISLSLAQRHGDDGSIQLHDLHVDYLRGQFPNRLALELIQEAVRRSFHVISHDPAQFASQLAGRLLPHESDPTIWHFRTGLVASAPRPWIQPLRAALQPPGTPLIYSLEGHKNTVRSVAMTPDGRRAISGSEDSTMKVWDLPSTGEVQTVGPVLGEVFYVALSRDGQQAILVPVHHWPRLVHLETGTSKELQQKHFARIFGAAISSDGRFLAMASENAAISIWETASGLEIQTLQGHAAEVYCVAMSGNSRYVISGSKDETLKVWDFEKNKEVRTLSGHKGAILGVAIREDGRVAISASKDNTLRVWDLETSRQLHVLEGYAGCFHGVAMSADGRTAVCALGGGRLKAWDVESGHTLHTLDGHYRSIYGVALSADGGIAMSASADMTIKVWDLTRQTSVLLGDHHSRVSRVSVSRSARRAATGSADATVRVWDVEKQQVVECIPAHSGPVDGVAITPDGKYIVSVAESDGLVKFWDFDRKIFFARESRGASAVTVTPDGKRAICIGFGTLEVRGFPRGHKVKFGGTPPYSAVYGIAVSPDGCQMLPACHGYRCILLSLPDGHEITRLGLYSTQYFAVSFSLDGRRVLLGGEGGRVHLYDLESGSLKMLTGHSWANVNDVALSPGGHMAASCSDDRTLKVWDLRTQSAVATFTSDAAFHCCVFTDENEIMAGDDLGFVHFLRLNIL